jgi:hypothetical protein
MAFSKRKVTGFVLRPDHDEGPQPHRFVSAADHGLESLGNALRQLSLGNREGLPEVSRIRTPQRGRSGSRATPTHASLTDWMSNFTKPLLAVDAEIVGNDAAATAERQSCPASVQH